MSRKQSFQQGAWAPNKHNKYQRARRQMKQFVKAARAARVTLRVFGASMARVGETFSEMRRAFNDH